MLTSVRITILCENRVNNPRLVAEQGLSLFVETENGNILFDCGQTDALVGNASECGVELQNTRCLFLSHGHYDHCGGLPALLHRHGKISVYCHPVLINKKYRVYPEGRLDIGVPWEPPNIENMGAEFNFTAHKQELLPDVWISGEIPRKAEFEQIDESYQQRVRESYITDELHDDMALILNTKKGLIVLMGCGHAGTINTLKHAMRITGNKTIFAVIGGMHLYQADQQKIDRVAHALEELNPEYLVPLHCTGFKMIRRMFDIFRERVQLLQVGNRFSMQ